MVAMAVPPVVTALSVRFAGNAPTPAVALTVSAFNTGIAIGSSIAAKTLDSSLGLTGPALVGTVMAALALLPLSALAATRATRTDTPEATVPQLDGEASSVDDDRYAAV